MKGFALIAALCLLVSPVVADEFTDRKALAEQGDADAQYNLGRMYSRGKGVPQDYAEAIKWYRLAADQGFTKAQYNLGVMYGQGKGVSQDYAEAAKWYRLTADQGLAEAMNNLGAMYILGQGVPQDLTKSYVWFDLAAASGHQDAIKVRDLVAEELTPETLNAAQQRAAKLFEEIQQRKAEKE